MCDKRHWTQEEMAFVLGHIDESSKWLAEKLGRSPASVRNMRARLLKLYSFCNEDCENCVLPDCFRPADSF